MIKSIVEHTLGAALMVLVAQIMQVDWQLLMMAFHSATHGRFFIPEVNLLFERQMKL
jgi:hypothetical protein